MKPQDLFARLEAGYEYGPMYGELCNERDRLADENAKLRERNRYLMKGDLLHVLTEQEYIDQCERERLMQVSIDALDKENTKLREVLKLAAFVLETMEHVTSWRFEGDGKVFDSAYFYDYLRELGVTE